MKGGGIIIKNKLFNRVLAIMLVIMMMPSLISLPSGLVYADETTNAEVTAVLQNWLNSVKTVNGKRFYHFSYSNDGMDYDAYFMKIVLPEESTTYPRIVYNYNSSGSISFACQVEENDKIVSYPIKLNVTVQTSVTGDGKVISESILKRQAANNFNVGNSNYGYLLEIASNVTSYEGKPLKLTAQVSEKTDLLEVEIKGDGWTIEDNFESINQNSTEPGFFATVWKWLTDAAGQVLNFLESLYNKVFLAILDGVFAAVCTAVGEEVTIDKVIFGRVGKLSINFWSETPEGTNSVMSVMKAPVNTWYNVFLSFAILVYLVALLIVGIKIVFASTGDAKAKYKETFQAWLTGVVILFLYPYVMKYTVKINNVLVEMIASDMENTTAYTPTPEVSEEKLDSISDSFGEDNFIASIRGEELVANGVERKDMMLYIRELAGNLGQMSLTVVYAVLLGELIVILVVYYKRVFMMAFLITIFPIVAIMYIVEKLALGNSRALGTWTKEYVILVLTQSFHAAVYVVVVNAGIESYIETDNWLFMLMCVIFLFQGEKILRSIFGMKSSANTIGDLAAAGVAGYGIIKSVPNMFKKGKQEDKDQKDLQDAEKNLHQNQSAKQMQTLQDNANRTNDSANNTANQVQSSEQDSVEDVTDDPMAGFATAQSAVIAAALRNKGAGKKNGAVGATSKVLGKAGNVALGAFDGMIGAAAGLATGDVTKAVGGALIGKELGNWTAGVVKKPIRGISNVYYGQKLKRKIRSGGMDNEFKKAGLDLASLDTEKQRLVRETLANLGSATTRGGKSAGELKMLKTAEKITKNKK